MSGMPAVEEKLKVYNQLQNDIQTLFTKKQQVLSQFNENTLVKGELDLLDEDATVYKLVGPILLAVELDDSKQNVNKRLEFIETELKKTDSLIAAKQKELNDLGDEIAEMQQKLQAEAAQSSR
jgi:prefoldin beta subunit